MGVGPIFHDEGAWPMPTYKGVSISWDDGFDMLDGLGKLAVTNEELVLLS